MIRRNVTRTILSGAEKTHLTDTPNTDTLDFAITSSDKLYLGFRKPFASRYFAMDTLNTNPSVLSVKYWDGEAFVSVEDLIDQTRGFTKSGFVAWTNPDSNWDKKAISPISDVELYWIEISVSADMSAGTKIQGILNIFCDDELLATYYPDLINDTRWIPANQTNFLPQYVSAKDEIVTRLRQGQIIQDESQVLDVNTVAVAATHAAAWIIMNPTARGEEDRDNVKEARKAMIDSLSKVNFDFDYNNDGEISESEKGQGFRFFPRGQA